MGISERLRNLIHALEDIEDPTGAEIRRLRKRMKELSDRKRTPLSNSESTEL